MSFDVDQQRDQVQWRKLLQLPFIFNGLSVIIQQL